jgi:hypothetical protein
MTMIHQLLQLSGKAIQLLRFCGTALALSTVPCHADPCAQNVDRAWMQVEATIRENCGRAIRAPGHTSPSSSSGDTELDQQV